MSDTVPLEEHLARTEKLTGLLKAVNDRYEEREALVTRLADDKCDLLTEVARVTDLYNTNFAKYKRILVVCCISAFVLGWVLAVVMMASLA